MLSPCFFKTTNSICSSTFSIGTSAQEEPPNAVGQIHAAARVSFALPVTLAVHTVGGVIAAGETLALLVPESDELVVNAMVPPREIDRIKAGGIARIRFTSFDRKTTPELQGHLAWVSPDQTGVGPNKIPAFMVRVTIDADESKRLGAHELRPGMEAEVMFTGEEKTVLSYIVKPLSDQFQRTFRER